MNGNSTPQQVSHTLVSERRWIWQAALCLAFLTAPLEAEVYNLHLVTDNVPDYTDLPSLVASSTAAWSTPEEKCIAIWRWGRRSRRQTSCAVEHGRNIWDPILHYNSYGAMNCGIISALNISCWLQLGYQARYVQLGDHTVSEVSWDQGKTWRLFDSSMSFFCYNHAGEVASCEEIKEAHACALSGGKSEPGHYYLYHPAPQCASHLGPEGWRCAADQPVGYNRRLSEGAASYTDGFSVDRYCQHARFGHRYVLNLRSEETYTRYWEPRDDAESGGNAEANDPGYFRPLANGSDPDDQHGLNNIRGNGLWVFEPNLAQTNRERFFYDSSGLAPPSANGPGPLLHPAAKKQAAWGVFQISAANVITSLRIDAEGFRAHEADILRIWVSRDAGINWERAWQSDLTGHQAIGLTLREAVAGGPFCWVKVEMAAAGSERSVGLNSLKITTVTQLNRRTLPKLTLGSNTVLLRADEPLNTVELWPPLHDGAYRKSAFAEDTVFSAKEPDGMYKATLGAASNNQPCSVTWRMVVPTDIADVHYGVISTVRSPRLYVSLQHSWDGHEFLEYYRHAGDGIPFDRQTHRTFREAEVPAKARQAFFRAVFFGASGASTYNMPGIQDLLIRVRHQPQGATFQPLEVTYNWTEHRETGDVTRSHTELIPKLPHAYVVNVAGKRDPTMNWVRIHLPGERSENLPARYGYSDGIDIGPGYEHPKLTYQWGSVMSAGKKYTVNRPSSESSGNPDSDQRELTNGILIAPTDEIRSQAVQPATAFWEGGEPVSFVLDLDQEQTVGGARVTTHQPNTRFGHPQRIKVAVSADGQVWQSVGVIQHDDLWQPPGDYEPWEHDDDPTYDRLPAGGRLAYSFPLVLDKPVKARFLRFVCMPLMEQGLGLSELQVFDQVQVTPWPDEIRLLDHTPPLISRLP